MSHKVDITRNDALRMEVVPYLEENTRTVYEMIAEGWHPADVAKAYGFLVKGRQIVRILNSPLWKWTPKRTRSYNKRVKECRVVINSNKHGKGYRYPYKDKADAVWLLEHGWHVRDVAIMLGIGIYVYGPTQWCCQLNNYIRSWTRIVHGNYNP